VARDLDASLPTVVDLPDGSFELPPDPRAVRRLRRVIGAYGVFSVGVWAAVVAWILTMPRHLPWPILAFPFVVTIAVSLFMWYGVKPRVLKADAVDIASPSPLPLLRQRMPRSDLALIYRGQFKERDRKATLVKYYLFVARDGTIGLKAPALAYLPEGVADFAQRLGVPLRGDFSERVQDPIDLSKTG
jgi:hypothetical protein